MKKLPFLFFSIFLCTPLKNTVLAQNAITNKPFLRHTQGMQGLGLQVGKASIDYKVKAEWVYHFSANVQAKLAIGGGLAKPKDALYKNLLLQPTIGYTLASNGRNWHFNLLGATNLTYTRYQENRLESTHKNFNVGLLVAGEVEVYIVRNLVLVLQAGPTLYFLKTPYKKLDYHLSIGLRMDF